MLTVFSVNLLWSQDSTNVVLVIKSGEAMPFYAKIEPQSLSQSELNTSLGTLKELAMLNDYLDFSIDSLINVNDTTTAFVHLGHKYLINEYSVNVISNDSVFGKTKSSTMIGSKFGLNSLVDVEKKLLSWYVNNGYPFAKIQVDKMEMEKGKAKVNLLLNTGDFYKIDSILIKSEGDVKLNVVQNRIGLKQGDKYDESKVSQIYSRINEVNYLSLERDPEVLFTKDKAVLYLYLKKKSSNRINGLVGFLPDANGKIEFTGNLELQLTNAFSGDETIEFNWRKLQQQSQDLKINFAYPYLLNTNIGLQQRLSIYRHDTTYTEVKSKSSLQYLFGRYKSIGIFIQSYTYNSLANTELGVINPESNLLQYGVSGQWSNLDYRFNPRRGAQLEMNVAIGDKKLQGVGDLDVTSESRNTQAIIDGDFNYYIPVKNRSVVKTSINAAHIENDFIIENELFRLGGVKSIRGFDEEAFSASTYVIGGLEYRFLTDLNSYFSAFSDYAYYEKKTIENIDLKSGYAWGVGLGAAFETAAGIFSVSYALGRVNSDPFLLKSGKIHFGFNAIF